MAAAAPAISGTTNLSISADEPLPADVPYQETFRQAGRICLSISPRLLAAQARTESINFMPSVISGKRRSPAGAMGISQFMPSAWNEWGNGGNVFNPHDAIPAQARFMCALHKKFGSVDLALAGYNAGPNAVTQYGGVPPFKETRTYIKRIKTQL